MDSSDQGFAPGGVAFDAALTEMRQRLDAVEADHDAARFSDELATLMTDLETAYEELRVADEEVRAQQAQIAELLEGQHLSRWQHERMLAVLPVPVLTSDAEGRITSVNAVAAGLLGIRIAHALGKPILSFVALEERSEVRRELSLHTKGSSSLRRMTTLVSRTGERLSVEAVSTPLPGSTGDRSWIFLGGEETAATEAVRALPEALVRLAGLPAAQLPLQEVLRRAGDICASVLPRGASLSVNLGDPAHPNATSATTELAQLVDGAQITAEEGPCLTAFADRGTVLSPDLGADSRWPRLGRLLPRREVSVVAAPLQVGEDLVGALNVYGVPADGVHPELVEAVELLATTIASVVRELGLRAELEATATDMRAALSSRATIDQAKGIVMADRGCDADEAFQHLVGLASSRHVKLRDLAAQLVAAVASTKS